MKKIILFLLVIINAIMLIASKPTVITNPVYELKRTGLYNIDKIERTKTQTLVHLHITFLPGWWVTFTKPEYLLDYETGKKYEAIDIKGATFDKKLWMPKSGDSTIVFVYPPLDKNVKKIDYNTEIFGISLEKNKQKSIEIKQSPNEVLSWLKDGTDSVKNKQFDSEIFFQPDTARILGFLNGYDKRLGFNTGIINIVNALTTESSTIVVQIKEDGRFEAKIPLFYPIYSSLVIDKQLIPVYLEPGKSLSVILNWSEFLIANQRPNKRYVFNDINYGGTLANLNTELNSVPIIEPDFGQIQKKVVKQTPEQFKEEQFLIKDKNLNVLNELATQNKLTPQALSILRQKVLFQYGNVMLSSVAFRKMKQIKDTAKKSMELVLPANYFDFLKEMPLDTKHAVINTEFNTFLNYLETSDLFLRCQSKAMSKPKKDYFEFLIEKKEAMSESDYELIAFLNKVKNNKDSVFAVQKRNTEIKRFFENHKDLLQEYSQKYIVALSTEALLKNWRMRDSVWVNEIEPVPGFTYNAIKLRMLKQIFENLPLTLASDYWNSLRSTINNNLIIETGDNYTKYCANKLKSASYTLPDNAQADVFKKIILPFKGKKLFVDFWATSCAPCVAGIKRMKPQRDIYACNRDFDFVFITDELSSPQEAYDKFVKEQELTNSYRLTTDEFNHLRQLFSISSIPRYVLVGTKGEILNDRFNMNNFNAELDKYLENK